MSVWNSGATPALECAYRDWETAVQRIWVERQHGIRLQWQTHHVEWRRYVQDQTAMNHIGHSRFDVASMSCAHRAFAFVALHVLSRLYSACPDQMPVG